MGPPVSPTHLQSLVRDSICVVEGFLSRATLEAAQQHVRLLYADSPELLYGPRGDGVAEKGIGLSAKQFEGQRFLPYPSGTELNLLGLDQRLLNAASAYLQTSQVLMHQNLVHVKHAGIADYDQPLHLDYEMHTLLVPAAERRFRTVICTIFLTDVGEANGPFAYVPKEFTAHLPPQRSVLTVEETLALRHRERALCVSAGTLLMYSPDDLYHRGTNLVGQGARRWSLTSSFYAAECTFMGGLRWFATSLDKNWPLLLENATVDQLATLGVPRPGHPYWTTQTLINLQARYPSWDLSEWGDVAG